MREVHPMPKIDVTLAQLNGAKVFSKLDTNSGFWQVPLAKESRPLTTFITPQGWFCFNKLPFRITSAPEHFQCRMSEILGDTPGVVCHVDDVLVSGKTKNSTTPTSIQFFRRYKQLDSLLTEISANFHVLKLYS